MGYDLILLLKNLVLAYNEPCGFCVTLVEIELATKQ